MRIAMVTSWRVCCGIARYSEELVEALNQMQNCQVTVLPAGLQVWKEQGRPLGWFHEQVYWSEIAKGANSADLVHVQFAPHLFGGLKPFRNLLPFLLKRLNKPAVITVHEIDLTGSPLVRFVKFWVQGRLFRSEKVRLLLSLTNFVAERLQQLGFKRVAVTPMWVPKPKLRLTDQEAKQKLGLTNSFVVTAFGFIVPRRGYETLLDALLMLPKDTLLVFAGGPHPLDRTGYYAKLMARISDHPLRSRIHVTGYLSEEEVDLWLAASDVVAAPFRQLSGSASLMRVLAHCKPIVASDLPPLRELAEQSKALVLVSANDPTAFAEAIARLKEPDERNRYERAAKEFADRQTVNKIAQMHCELYKVVLQDNLTDNVLF